MKKVIALACACAAMAPLPAAASARTTHHIGTRTSAPAVLGTAPLLRPAQLGQLQRLLHGGQFPIPGSLSPTQLSRPSLPAASLGGVTHRSTTIHHRHRHRGHHRGGTRARTIGGANQLRSFARSGQLLRQFAHAMSMLAPMFLGGR